MEAAVYDNMAQAQGTHWWFTARREILRRQLLALRLPAGADILEVGCGTGANLSLLAEFGRVVGFDPSAQALAHAAARSEAGGQVRFVRGRCPQDLDASGQAYDLVCLLDVLEHVEEDELSLRRIGRLLKPGGRLLVTVPAYGWLWGPHDVAMHHMRRYSRRTLQSVCTRAGLQVQRVSYFNTLLFPLAVVDRLVDRIARRSAGALQPPPEPLNTVLDRVFRFERHLLDRADLPFGLSLLLVASPPSSAA